VCEFQRVLTCQHRDRPPCSDESKNKNYNINIVIFNYDIIDTFRFLFPCVTSIKNDRDSRERTLTPLHRRAQPRSSQVSSALALPSVTVDTRVRMSCASARIEGDTSPCATRSAGLLRTQTHKEHMPSTPRLCRVATPPSASLAHVGDASKTSSYSMSYSRPVSCPTSLLCALSWGEREHPDPITRHSATHSSYAVGFPSASPSALPMLLISDRPQDHHLTRTNKEHNHQPRVASRLTHLISSLPTPHPLLCFIISPSLRISSYSAVFTCRPSPTTPVGAFPFVTHTSTPAAKLPQWSPGGANGGKESAPKHGGALSSCALECDSALGHRSEDGLE
jgi:hypothetical protein